MRKTLKLAFLLLLSGLMLSLATTYLSILLICVSIAPLFVILNDNSKKSSLEIGFVFGFGIGLGLFFWMIKGVSHYTGNGILYGILLCIISSIFLGIYLSIISWIIRSVWISNPKSNLSLFLNRICIAAIWTVLESGLAFVLQSFPLHCFRIGLPFVTNIYTIQLTSIAGLSILSFICLLVNLFLAEFIIQKKRTYLIHGFLILALTFIIGAVCFYAYKPNLTGKSFKIAIVSDNVNPETKWNPENGNSLANNYFQLCKDAVELDPDFIIWPETAIPWTYTKDDDLLKEIIKISSTQNLINVIGINNENNNDKKLYNSVFYIDNQNNVKGIYNKQILLKGIEEPLGEFLVPFLSQDGFVISRGKSSEPIQTRFGKAGNLICNEVVVENCGIQQTQNGANFMFNFSNDGWFKDNYTSALHFYYARLQAVENRKDISVVNNCGINGIISSDGKIITQKKDTVNTIISGTIQPNSNLSVFIQFPFLFPLILILYILFYLLTIKLRTIRAKQLPQI